MQPRLFLLSLLSLLIPSLAHSQTPQDSVIVYDTVTVYKAPLIINKTVVLPPMRYFSDDKFFAGFTGSLNYYSAYSSVCEECKEFYETSLKTNKPAIGYGGGLSLLYKPGRLFFIYKIQYNQYREKFSFTDSSSVQHNSINKLSYTDNFLGAGIRIGREAPVQLLVSAEARLSILNSIHGFIPDSANQQSVVSLKDVHEYRKLVPGVHLSVKLLCYVLPRTYLMPEISYGLDLKSTVVNQGPFTIQRNIPSLQLSLMRGF